MPGFDDLPTAIQVQSGRGPFDDLHDVRRGLSGSVGVAGRLPSGVAPPSLLNQLVGPAGLRTMASGVPVVGQLADPLNAVTNAALAPTLEPLMDRIPGHNPADDLSSAGNFNQRYQRAIYQQHAMDAASNEAFPQLTAAQKLAGGILGAVGGAKVFSPVSSVVAKFAPKAGLIPTALANAADAGMVGGATGYLGGTGGLTDPSRIRGAEFGGAFGTLAGGALAPVGKAAATAAQKLASAIKGTVNVGADVAPPGATGLASAVQAPSSAVNRAYDLLHQATVRGGQSPQEAIAGVNALGPQGVYADANPAVTDFAKTVARTPGQGLSLAKAILVPRQEGQIVNGVQTLPSAAGRIGDRLAQTLGVNSTARDATQGLIGEQQAAAQPLYAKAFQAPPVPKSALEPFISDPLMNDAYAKAANISRLDAATNPDVTPLPATMPDTLDFQTLHYMKRGLNDLYSENVQSGMGQATRNATTGFTQGFTQRLGQLNPDYAAANSAFSGPEHAMEAIQAGRDYMSENPQNAEATLADWTNPGDRQMFRVGAAQGAQDALGAPSATTNVAPRAGVLPGNQFTKFQSLFDSPDDFAQFHNFLQGEHTMAGTRNAVLSGSDTVANAAQMANSGVNPLEIAGHAAGALQGKPENIMGLVGALMKAGGPAGGMTEPVANSAAALAFTPGATSTDAFQQGLQAAARRAALAQAIASGRPVATIGAGLGAGDAQQPSTQ